MVHMPIAVIGIGVPGSGKTTILMPLAERFDCAYINRDDLREELLGDARDQSRNKEIWEEGNRRTIAALLAGKDVVIDATFVEGWKRREMVQFVRDHGATSVVGFYADVPAALAKERNQGRNRTVPDDVIDRMEEQLAKEPPSTEDGFDHLFVTPEELEEFFTRAA
jgi:predicted kinase